MKIRWRYGIAFPLALAVSLGALAAWLGRISEVQVEEVVLNPNEPQYSMKGINGKRFDQEGRLKENLSAVDAVQYPNSADVHLTNRIFRFTATAACCTKSAATRLRTIFKTKKSFLNRMLS